MLPLTLTRFNAATLVLISVLLLPDFSGSLCIADPLPRLQPDGSPTPAAQGPDIKKSSSSTLDKVKQWREAVAQHRPATSDQAAVMIARWPARDLESVVKYITKLASLKSDSVKRALARPRVLSSLGLTAEEVRQGSVSRILLQGALLHTDIALLELEGFRVGERLSKFIDGRVISIARNPHWEFARRLVGAASSDAAKSQVVRQWYIATIAYLQKRLLMAYAENNLEHALKMFPFDSRILFYAGVLHEILASPLNQNVPIPPGMRRDYRSRIEELKLARHFFQKAVAVDPDAAEARLRLGRVVGLLGDHQHAVAELQRAASALKDRQLQYYASLYLGHELAMLFRRSEARRQFERAAELYPSAQSPLLALSRLADGDNDPARALQAIERLFATSAGDVQDSDPWWSYNVAHVRDVDALLAGMYEAFGGLPR